jgi:uncharacterized protein YcnI
MLKRITALSSSLLFVLFAVVPAFAHVVVKPDTVGEASYQTFSVGVPNEKDSPVVDLRLIIPSGLESVSPNVKPGWTISLKKVGTGDDAKVNEIDWTGGSIPPEQRDDFVFSAKVPAKETTLAWKAYQTYQDGTVVSWDQEPSTKNGEKSKTPYSTTKVVNDLSGQNSQTAEESSSSASADAALWISIVAGILALAALIRSKRT